MCNAEIIDPIIDLHRKKRHPHRQPTNQALQVEGRQRRHRLAPINFVHFVHFVFFLNKRGG